MLQASVHQLPPDQTPTNDHTQIISCTNFYRNLCTRRIFAQDSWGWRAAEANGVLLGSQRLGGAPHRPMESIDSRKEETRSLGRKCVGVTGFSLHASSSSAKSQHPFADLGK